MGQQIGEALRWALLQSNGTIQFWDVILRAVVVYAATLFMIRFGEKRFLGKSTAFDVIIGMILGAMMSRAINGVAPLLATLGAGVTLVGLHWLFAILALYSHRFGDFIKGKAHVLVKDGVVQPVAMRRGLISKDDLLEAVRFSAGVTNLAEVREARLERNCGISVIPQEAHPKILEVSVAEGVQTIRIQIE